MADAKFTEACFLMDYIKEIAVQDYFRAAMIGRTGFREIMPPSEAAGGAHQIISRLTSRTGHEVFLNLSPATLSVLQPKIRLYKLIYEAPIGLSSPSPTIKEFKFPDFYDKTNISNVLDPDNFKRIGGAGIKDVNWKLAGTNPAEADKVINVDMTFEFQTVQDLIGSRMNPDGTINNDGGNDYEANFIDLILHPPGLDQTTGAKARVSAKKGEYVPKHYQIRMDVGWADPELGPSQNFPDLTTEQSNALRRELKKQHMSVILNLVSHEFSIEENGKISLSVEYIGAFEESINSDQTNILRDVNDKPSSLERAEDDVEEKRQRIADMEEYIECLKLSDADNTAAEPYQDNIDDLREDIGETKEDIEEFEGERKSVVYQRFLTRLNSKVFTIDVDEDEIEEWIESINEDTPRPQFKFSKMIEREEPDAADEALEVLEETTSAEDAEGDDVDDVIETAKDEAEDPSKGYISFIFLGDIIEAATRLMTPVFGGAVMADSALLFGPVIINHPRGEKMLIPLSSIPISYSRFTEFFFDTIVRKQLASYPLKQFIKDIFEKMVRSVLQPSECFPSGRQDRKIEISMSNFTVSEDVADRLRLDSISYEKRGYNDHHLVYFQGDVEPPRDEEKVYNCMFFFVNSYTAEELKANEIDDREKGIYHFFIGADRGIVKSIDYTRTDVEGLREARQADARNLGQIRDVYNAKVTLVGNSLFYPGMKVFLNPPLGFGAPEEDGYGDDNNFGSMANLLGIGGYYDIITVESTISRGGAYETVLECIFAQSGGTLDSIEARCEGILENPPERDKGLLERAGDAIGAVVDFLTSPFS